jgi:hypothetical protein
MQADETGSIARCRSTRRRAPNINGQDVLTLGEAAQLRARLAAGMA